MALPSLASLQEFQEWHGSAVDASRATAILSAASTLIRSSTGRVWVDADGPESGMSATAISAARTVCLIVAERVYTNPSGATQEQSGPYSRSVAAWAASGLTLRPEELAMLNQVSPGVPGLHSVRVVAPAAAAASRWKEWQWVDDYGEEYLS